MILRIMKANLDWLKPQPGGGDRIQAAAGVKLPESTYSAPERRRRLSGRLDVAALISGAEKTCYRYERNDGAQNGGVDVFFQCALLGNQTQADVDSRALASLAYAVGLINEGVKVNLYACWVSESSRHEGTYCLAWADVTDISLDYLAAVIDESTFRHYTDGIMRQRGKKWPMDFSDHGGSGMTVQSAAHFKTILEKGGVLTSNGVVIDWNNGNVPL